MSVYTYDEKKKEFGSRLCELRTKRGYSRKEMCDLLQIDEKSYGKYEQGARYPQTTKLPLLAQKLNTSIDYLLCGTITQPEEQLFKLLEKCDKAEKEEIIAIVEKIISFAHPQDTP